jgi:hypothetical protein
VCRAQADCATFADNLAIGAHEIARWTADPQHMEHPIEKGRVFSQVVPDDYARAAKDYQSMLILNLQYPTENYYQKTVLNQKLAGFGDPLCQLDVSSPQS